MRVESEITKDIKLIMTKDEIGYLEVLDNFIGSEFIKILTYNIGKEDGELIERLKNLSEEEKVTIVTNIPRRFNRYTSRKAREKAREMINEYIESLNPDNYDAYLKVYFNTNNHSKIIMTDNIAYIGSSNFSDKSCLSYECGILIKNKNYINDIDKKFIDTVVKQSTPYYSDYSLIVSNEVNIILEELEFYYEKFYWSFFSEDGSADDYFYNKYLGYDALLSNNIVVGIELLSDKIKNMLEECRLCESYDKDFYESGLFFCEEIKRFFGPNSELSRFSMIGNYSSEGYSMYEYASDGILLLRDLKSYLKDTIEFLDINKTINSNIDNT
ncbi:hypothetical protein GM168_01535 [Clostridium perfringens]|nr:hypothetical protein [Clostridium perfringens]MDK0840496.1 phospholipase D-like domain-containing protein [Clostridium perfringens]